jgi:hypothetical protein
MSDRVRDFTNFEQLAAFCAKYMPDFPAARMGELAQDIITCAVIHTDPIPGSPPEVRQQAIVLMQDFISTLEPGANINPSILKDAGKLPRDNRSDSIFVTKWASTNKALAWNPSMPSHFIKRLTDETDNHDGDDIVH